MTQERTIIITNKKIYNVKKQSIVINHCIKPIEIQRVIAIEKLLGVTKSVSEPIGGEFVFHIKDAYDYRMRSDGKEQIIDVVKKLFMAMTGKALPLYGVVN